MTRANVIDGLIERAGRLNRSVYGIDDKGHGGRLTLNRKVTDGWNTPVDQLVWACVEGEPWVTLPRK